VNDRTWELANGEERVFAFLQVDIAGHSRLEGPGALIQETKINLERFVREIIEKLYGGRQLIWVGDGGAFLFLINDPHRDYDRAINAAIHLLMSMVFFNSLREGFNLLDTAIQLRITCHEGRAHWHENPGLMHSSAINYFLKHERDIGLVGTLSITGSIYRQIVSANLRAKFSERGSHGYIIGGQELEETIYSVTREEIEGVQINIPTLTTYNPVSAELQEYSITSSLLSDVTGLIADVGPQRLDLMTLVGTSFFDNADFRRLIVKKNELPIRLLLLSPKSYSVNVLNRDLRAFLGESGSVADWVKRTIKNVDRLSNGRIASIEYRFLQEPPPWKLICAVSGQRVVVSCRFYGRGRGGYGPMLRFEEQRQNTDDQMNDKFQEPTLGTLILEDFELRWELAARNDTAANERY